MPPNPTRLALLEKVAEAAIRVVRIGLVQPDGALSQYVAALAAHAPATAEGGETVEVRDLQIKALTSGAGLSVFQAVDALAALSAAGYVVVPREPTNKQAADGCRIEHGSVFIDLRHGAFKAAYRAIVADALATPPEDER